MHHFKILGGSLHILTGKLAAIAISVAAQAQGSRYALLGLIIANYIHKPAWSAVFGFKLGPIYGFKVLWDCHVKMLFTVQAGCNLIPGRLIKPPDAHVNTMAAVEQGAHRGGHAGISMAILFGAYSFAA